MTGTLNFPTRPTDIPENISQRRIVAIAAIKAYVELATNTQEPLATSLYQIIYRFWPGIFGDYDVSSLRDYIRGYSNDYIVMYALDQLKKSAAILYGVEVYRSEDPILNEMYQSVRQRGMEILNILGKWLEAQNDEQVVQIAELEELTAEDFRSALGWNLAANFHLFDLWRKQTQSRSLVEAFGAIYDLNFTPDKIHRIAEIFAYMMWKTGRIGNLEIVMAFPPNYADFNEFTQAWWAERTYLQAEQAELERTDHPAAYARDKVFGFHQNIGYYLRIISKLADPAFPHVWRDEYLGQLDANVIETTGFLQARDMLKSLFDGLLRQSCSDEMIDNVLGEINAKKGR